MPGALNFLLFVLMMFSSFASGALVTTQGWMFLNRGSVLLQLRVGTGLLRLTMRQ